MLQSLVAVLSNRQREATQEVGPYGGRPSFFMPFYSASTGQGTVTRLPQLTQVPSRKYQTNSQSSKDAIMLKTCDPHGHTWMGPNCLKSLPKDSGRVSQLRRKNCRVSRRNRGLSVPYQLLRPFRAPTRLIRLTAHIVTTASVSA